MSETFRGYIRAPLNLPFPTLGGRQLWADSRVDGGWRIQANVLTGHSRLLDHNDIRRGWGSPDHCIDMLEHAAPGAIHRRRRSHLVVLLHGLGRSKNSFTGLARAIERAGFEVLAINYPSLFGGVEEHAARVDRVLGSAPGNRTVSFVTHSLGALVLRHLLGGTGSWRNRIHLHGAVMISPPNRGSALAEALGRHPAFRLVAGQSGRDANISNAPKVPPLHIPHIVIAGSLRGGKGCNPFFDGDDDGIVGLEETRLPESDTVVKVEACHTVIPNNPKTIAAVIRFLKQPAGPAE